MTIIFLNKNTLRLRLLQKYLKIKGYPLFLPKGMQHTALVGKTIWLEAIGLLAGVATRTEPSDGEYEKHLRAEPQDWTGGGNFARHAES